MLNIWHLFVTPIATEKHITNWVNKFQAALEYYLKLNMKTIKKNVAKIILFTYLSLSNGWALLLSKSIVNASVQRWACFLINLLYQHHQNKLSFNILFATVKGWINMNTNNLVSCDLVIYSAKLFFPYIVSLLPTSLPSLSSSTNFFIKCY